MSIDGSLDSKPTIIGNSNGNGIAAVSPAAPLRLKVSPNSEHKPDKYDDMETEMEEFSPLLFSSLDRFLPNSMLSETRDVKAKYMREIMLKYFPRGERTRAQKHKAYRDKISRYEPLHTELYSVLATNFFVPSFLKAITDNSEDSFRSIMSEPTPGVFTFEMFQPQFCDLLLSEVENFEQWVFERKLRIMQPNTMNEYGVVLDDFGLEAMLGKLMDDYIRPLSKVFYYEVGGSTLDSHHGFVVEYGIGRDIDLAFHVDDSEVTLNVCLSKQFVGGELFFRGVRCEKHVNTETLPEEIFDYCHVRGHAILHRGRHRHGARATTGGNRTNLILWCRSSVFRELKKYQKDFSSWCGECQREKKERQQSTIAATKQELLKMDGETIT
ncbi:2-oxoglutarate and iron-dependent oxygenase domain-containing protein [Drosera capensis]